MSTLILPKPSTQPDLYHGKYVAGMFAKGEQGAWYDPSDLSTLYQDAAGTIPVTAVEQPVGLILDKSKGAVLSNGAAAYNFLFYTEEITNSYWAPTQVSKSATTAPDGTNTACKVVATAINAQHHVLPTPEPRIPAGGPVLKYSFFAKSEGYRYLGIWGLNALSYFDLVDGVVVSKSVNHISATITKLSGGWNYIDIRFVRYNPNSYRIYTIETPGVHAFLGDGVSGCSIWHPDLRLESNANAQPVYQPIGSDTWLSKIPGNHATQATTTSRPTLKQDASGKYYLSFDGVDDYLVTGSIDFTGTDKMTVMAGVRKLSDAASGVVIELSGDAALNRAFSFFAPSTFGGMFSYRARSTGSLPADLTISGYPAPISNVVVLQSNIATDLLSFRVNGTQAASTSTDQGTGNYGNYPLYIGRRGGTELPFNGRLYGLIVRGAATDDLHLTHAEKYLANKSGVTL